jgi:hypothetical protein
MVAKPTTISKKRRSLVCLRCALPETADRISFFDLTELEKTQAAFTAETFCSYLHTNVFEDSFLLRN